MTPRVTAVVLSWNGRAETLACLRSLAETTYPTLSVVVVDNDSSDDVGRAVTDAFPDVRVIRLSENRGFAGGVNAGLNVALADRADHVLLLNNDATVEPGFLEPLVAAASAAGVGAVSSQILHSEPPHLVWYAGASYDPRRGHQGRHEHFGEPRLPASVEPYVTDRACGGAMLVTRAAIDRVGGLDESLFAYAEDVDWSMRARAAGLSILVVPASVVYHAVSAASGGASSPDTIYYALRNGLVVAERVAPLGRLGSARRRGGATAAFAIQALLSPRPRRGLKAVAAAMHDVRRRRLGKRAV